MNIEINPPIKVGDKVYLKTTSFYDETPFSFLKKYTQYKECIVNRVQFEYDMETKRIIWKFGIQGESQSHIYTNQTALTKEQLYESFRVELETLIPKEMRDYLWPKE